MKTIKKLFRFQPDRKTEIALILGLLSILTSCALLLRPESLLWSIFFREILQICLFGTIIPLIILEKEKGLNRAGIHFKRAWLYLPLSLLLGTFTFTMITGNPGTITRIFTHGLTGPALYVMTANVFEVIFFFVYLRYFMEEAFGILPGIVLTAGFYSLHHAGFQPEFLKLFIVGLAYISIFRIAGSWLICFPMWFAGGLGDVLFSSEAVDPTMLSGYRAILPAAVMTTALLISLKRQKGKDRGGFPRKAPPTSDRIQAQRR